ncbi:breast cancer type 1 susceptibility protein isoform X1 [Cyrtonyx montezumae]|uniref:breast cancer type 1 susceptibility protein isoform X1 n=1 Tax=Cyrtonyx montezumae TaxID=9017 RepID=UPI0032DA25A3
MKVVGFIVRLFSFINLPNRLEHKELEEPKSPEKNENSYNTQPPKLGAEEIILPDVVGETDLLKETSSKKSMLSTTEHDKSDQVNTIESQSSSSNVFDADLLTVQCDGIGNASPLKNDGTSFSKNAEEMDAEETLYSSKNQWLDLEDSSEGRLDKIKKKEICVPSVEDVEVYEPVNDSLPEKEHPLESLLQPKMPHCPTLREVSRKRLKESIQKVNEWFSKSDEIQSSSSSQNDPAEAINASGEGDISLSDSCISEKTNPILDSEEVAVVEENKRWTKQTTYSIKDKIFGKTYERERKSNPSVIRREILPASKKEDMAAEEESLNNSRKDRLKRKRKPACVLQPEDFIKKKDLEEANRCPQSINSSFGDTEKKKYDENSAVKENPRLEKRKGSTLAEFKEGGLKWKHDTEKVTSKHSDGQLEVSNSDQKNSESTSSAAKGRRHSARTRCAIHLVVGRNPDSFDSAEPLIGSYLSREEPSKVDCEQRQVRRSRRLQLLSEEITKETGKMRIIKEARNSDSGPEGSFFGVEKNVLVHNSQCKDLRKQQDLLSYMSLTDLNGADLEANEIRISPKNSSNTDKSRSLFNPTSSCQHSNLSFPLPNAGSQEGEIPPSKTVVRTVSNLTEEKKTGLCTTFSQDKGCCLQNVPEDFRIEKSLMAKSASELTVEAEDSELDMDYLRNILRSSKRQSFSLYPTPMKACTTDDVATEKLNTSCQVEKSHSKYLKTENLAEEKTIAENLSSVCENFKTCISACVSPVSCFVSNAECVHAVEHHDLSKVANNGNLVAPVRMCAARDESRNGPQKGEQGCEKTLSTDVGLENNLRQDPLRSNRSQNDQSNTEEHAFQRTDVSTVYETYFSSESNQVEKAEVDGKGPMQHVQPSPMVCPTACQQNSAEFNCKVTEKKSGKRERRLEKGSDEQVIQTLSTGFSDCLVREALEESLKGHSDFSDLSETPDGLLCSDNDTEENASFCVTNRKDTSAVFVKRSGAALVKEVNDTVVSCKPGSEGIQRSRRRARKLQSSDEESSEGESLPCFQELIFGKSVSTPLQIKKQVTSVVQSSANPSLLPCSEHLNEDSKQKTLEAALSNECVSPTQESECSVDLFSSQSNMSEESVDGAQELKKTLTQVGNVNKSKEALHQSCSGGLNRRENNSVDEYRETTNMGTNLGEASGYNSETSCVEDSHEPFSQGEILSTQQKNAMQNNLQKLQQEMAVLEAVLNQHGSRDTEVLPICKELPRSSSGGTLGMEQMRQEMENMSEHDSRTKLSEASALLVLHGDVPGSPNSSSSSVKHPHSQTAEATNSSAVAQSDNKNNVQVYKSERSVCFPIPVLPNASGKENTARSGATYRTGMLIVASGLNQSEQLMVQKFARKTQSTFSNHITDGTTHVIMKTGIIQSLKEGRILEEENFEVKGDVINGRNHQGPKRSRQSLTKKIFKDFEICCYGPFTDMTTGHLEWIVELCGASVVKQLHLFTHKVNSTAVVVVQPDAWMEGTSYEAIQRKNNVAVVTREWVLDSVACFECQELDAYLVS